MASLTKDGGAMLKRQLQLVWNVDKRASDILNALPHEVRADVQTQYARLITRAARSETPPKETKPKETKKRSDEHATVER